MAEIPIFRCTLCDQMNFSSQESLDNHIALHTLESAGKLRFHVVTHNFYCCACDHLYKTIKLDTHASALVHLKVHDEMMLASKALARVSHIYEISGSQVYCIGCHVLNIKIDKTTIGKRYGAKRDLFNNASEFVQHFYTEHMYTAPVAVSRTWKSGYELDAKKFSVKQCSFCGEMVSEKYPKYYVRNWCYDHMCKYSGDCYASYKKIHEEIVIKKAISALFECYKLAKVPNSINSRSCLSSVDNLVINKIADGMQ